MTIDDESSIYVGGLPYDCSEDRLREVFDIYGNIVAVKMINDREVGGKCYGFVTFKNPRSAVHAMDEMNGRSIGGRMVRVGEVRTRGGKQTFGRENFHRNIGRESDWARGRDRQRDHNRDRNHFSDRISNHSIERDKDMDQEYGDSLDHRLTRHDSFDQDGDRDQDYARRCVREWDRDDDMDQDHNKEINRIDFDRSKDKDKDKDRERVSRRLRSVYSYSNDRPSREPSPNHTGEFHEELRAQLRTTLGSLEEIQKEVLDLQDKVDGKEQHVVDLQKKYQKLEEALLVAKELSSRQRTRLSKLKKSYMRVQDCSEKLKSSELELQSLVDNTKVEVDGDDIDICGSL